MILRRRMKVIRFRRLHKDNWEIAFNEEHLFEKLDGDMAEVIMPAKSWLIRLWRKFFPLKGIECTVDLIENNEQYEEFLKT